MESVLTGRILVTLAVLTMPATLAAQPTPWPRLDQPINMANGVTDGKRDAALIVGIEDYAYAPDIPGARRNAEDWYAYLRKTRGLPIGNIVLLRDGQASREEIEHGAKKAAARVGKGGTLWTIFIGHGAPAPDGKDGVLVGVDAQQTVRSLAARSLRRSTLLKSLEKGRQGRTVVLLDACFSGKSNSGAQLAPGMQPMLAAKPAKTGRRTLLFTAARGNEFAGPLPSGARPAFSYLMLGALRGWGDQNGDGRVTGQEAVDYARTVLSALVTSRLQSPELIGPAATALAAGATEKGPDLDAIRLGRKAPPPPVAKPSTPTAAPPVIEPAPATPRSRCQRLCAHAERCAKGTGGARCEARCKDGTSESRAEFSAREACRLGKDCAAYGRCVVEQVLGQ